MRNLKRVFSLALALVMVLGMMVITTSAATFTDAEEITYTEAVEVMSKIGVITGDNGSFYPNRTLTREEGAAFICYMLMGKTNADKLTGSGMFADVKADRWSAGEIEYCANLGIIKGYTDANGDLVFNPKGELTGVAFGRMLLGALGYDGDVEGYTGGNWASAIMEDIIAVGLDIRGVALDEQLTREQAAEMALYALQADLVEYETKGTSISVNGMEIVSGASKATAVTSTTKDYNTITDESDKANNNTVDTDASVTYPDTVQFAEKYFSNLKLTAGTPDDFGRAADHGWEWKTVEFYNELKTPVVTYTAATRSNVVAKDLAGYKYLGNKVNDVVEIAGKTVAATLADFTANGKLVEIYAHPVTKAITSIVEVEYQVAEVQKIEVDKKTGDVDYKICNVTYTDYADVDVTDEIVVYEGIAKDDVVTTAWENGVLYVYPTTSFVGTQTATKTDRGVQTITVADKNYTVGEYATGSFNNGFAPSKFFVDQYGFVVLSVSTATASTDYLKVVDVQGILTPGIDGATPALNARVVLADGTVAVYPVAVKYDAANTRWEVDGLGTVLSADADGADVASDAAINDNVYGYTLEDGVLTLETLADGLDVALTAADSGEIFAGYIGSFTDDTNSWGADGGSANTVLVTENTIVVNYNNTLKTAEVYTGFAKLPDLTRTTAKVVVKAGMGNNASITSAVVIFIETASAAKDASDYVYIDAADFTEIGAGAKKTYAYTGIAPDGTEVALTVKAADKLTTSGLYTLNVDGSVKNTNLITLTDGGDVFIQGAKLVVSGNMVKAGDGSFYYMTDATNVVYLNPRVEEEVNDNTGIVVLVPRTNNIAAIYIYAD